MFSRTRFLALLTVALIAPAGCGGSGTSGGAGGGASGTGSATAAPGTVVAVKIDNVSAARPATGLGGAEVVYVEPVEGGLSRIIAVFSAQLPDLVGPVRSARETDIDVLAQYGHPTFAYSGAAPEIVPKLRSASFVNAAQSDVPVAYVRRSTHAAPHNLYVNPTKLPAGSGRTPATVLNFGAAPAGGTPSTDQKVRYPAASYEFRWSASAGRWQVWMDGTPYVSTEAGQLGAATVVVQQVHTHLEPFAEDPTGAHAPVAETVGSGAATVLRDGQAYAASWSRSDASSPTRYSTSSGQPLPLANGPVWVLLVPVNG